MGHFQELEDEAKGKVANDLETFSVYMEGVFGLDGSRIRDFMLLK